MIIVFQEENAKLLNYKNEIVDLAKRNTEEIYHINYQNIVKTYKTVSKEFWHTFTLLILNEIKSAFIKEVILT